MRKLSIVIPAYNEEKFIGGLLEKILAVELKSLGVEKEIIVVDDCSKDQTPLLAQQWAQSHPEIRYIRQEKNQGKGAAVKRGIQASTGDWVLVQDADLEYDPEDYIPMIKKALSSGDEQVSVYGSRVLGDAVRNQHKLFFKSKNENQKFANWAAGRFLTFFVYFLYGLWVTDTLTAYKLYPAKILKSYEIKTKGFETDHELTALLFHNKVRIVEVPIRYYPRSVEEGKKIKTIDFFIALKTLMRFRFG